MAVTTVVTTPAPRRLAMPLLLPPKPPLPNPTDCAAPPATGVATAATVALDDRRVRRRSWLVVEAVATALISADAVAPTSEGSAWHTRASCLRSAEHEGPDLSFTVTTMSPFRATTPAAVRSH